MQEVEVVAVATREATVVEVEASPGLMLGDRGTGWARQHIDCLMGGNVDNSVCSVVRTGLSKCVLPPCIYMFESQSLDFKSSEASHILLVVKVWYKINFVFKHSV